MRWGELSCEWQPVYVLTELGRALSKAGFDPDDYLNGVKSSTQGHRLPRSVATSPVVPTGRLNKIATALSAEASAQ